jgi:hypothetical protein
MDLQDSGRGHGAFELSSRPALPVLVPKPPVPSVVAPPNAIGCLWKELECIEKEYNAKLKGLKSDKKAARHRYKLKQYRVDENFGAQIFDVITSHAKESEVQARYQDSEPDAKVNELAQGMLARLEEVKKKAYKRFGEPEGPPPPTAAKSSDPSRQRRMNIARYVERNRALKKGKQDIVNELRERDDGVLSSGPLKDKRDEVHQAYLQKLGEMEKVYIAELQALELAFIPIVVQTYQKQLKLSQQLDATGIPAVELDEE